MPTKAQKIIEIYEQEPDLKHEEIAQRIGCDTSYVTKVIGKLEDHMITEAISFHLQPPKTQPKEQQEEQPIEPEEYICGACGHEFTATKQPDTCPSCGVTFA